MIQFVGGTENAVMTQYLRASMSDFRFVSVCGLEVVGCFGAPSNKCDQQRIINPLTKGRWLYYSSMIDNEALVVGRSTKIVCSPAINLIVGEHCVSVNFSQKRNHGFLYSKNQE